MAKDLSKWPLLVLMDHVKEWVASAQSREFWHTLVEHEHWAERLREEVKTTVVWLELKGQEEAASQLDERMSAFRKAVWEFQHACEGTYPPDDDQCRDLAETMIDKAEWVVAVCEDLDQEVPQETWEGFLDG